MTRVIKLIFLHQHKNIINDIHTCEASLKMYISVVVDEQTNNYYFFKDHYADKIASEYNDTSHAKTFYITTETVVLNFFSSLYCVESPHKIIVLKERKTSVPSLLYHGDRCFNEKFTIEELSCREDIDQKLSSSSKVYAFHKGTTQYSRCYKVLLMRYIKHDLQQQLCEAGENTIKYHRAATDIMSLYRDHCVEE
mgnify:FL=1